MGDLVGNLLVAQSGGPTSVINSSLAGVVIEAGKHPGSIEEIYGGLNGILGVLNEDLVDLQEEKRHTIEALKHTPAAGLGTCRYKIDFKKKPEKAERDMARLFEVFQAQNIRYFLYIGGNDSQDTADKIHQESQKRGYEMRVIGIPKTIDNDLPFTDHCPGYGSVIKYNAATVMEVGLDVQSMATDDGSCCVVEVMGRAAGWIAAGTVLAKRCASDAPHIILVPELLHQPERFLAKVQDSIARHRYCVVVVAEGLRDERGKVMGEDSSRVDAFGHPLLSGIGALIEGFIQEKLGLKSRSLKLGYAQRAAAHYASEIDIEEALECGAAGVRAGVQGQSGVMVKLVRLSDAPYRWTTGIHPLGEVANVERPIPRDWLAEDGYMPNEKFVQYAAPLISGELALPVEGGLPKYAMLDRVRIEKKLAPRS